MVLPEIRQEPGTLGASVGITDRVEIVEENSIVIGAIEPAPVVPLSGEIDSTSSPPTVVEMALPASRDGWRWLRRPDRMGERAAVTVVDGPDPRAKR
jgi:hypothetical protein